MAMLVGFFDAGLAVFIALSSLPKMLEAPGRPGVVTAIFFIALLWLNAAVLWGRA